MVEPIKVQQFIFSDKKLSPHLLIKIMLDLLLGDWEDWVLKFAVLVCLFNESADVIDRETLESVVFIEFHVVELAESCLGLGGGLVGDVESLVPDIALLAHLDTDQPIFLPDLLGI